MRRNYFISLLLVWALLLGAGAAKARYLNPDSGRFQTMDSYEGTQTDPLRLHKYLYAHGNPVMMVDPSGLMSAPEQGVTGGGIGVIAARVGIVIGRTQAKIYASYAWSVQHSVQLAFWVEVGGFGASYLPDVLTAIADFGDSLNRQAAMSEGGFSPGIVRGVEAEESILRPAIQNVGGKFLGGTVSGIDDWRGAPR